jgi:hypothetical protein
VTASAAAWVAAAGGGVGAAAVMSACRASQQLCSSWIRSVSSASSPLLQHASASCATRSAISAGGRSGAAPPAAANLRKQMQGSDSTSLSAVNDAVISRVHRCIGCSAELTQFHMCRGSHGGDGRTAGSLQLLAAASGAGRSAAAQSRSDRPLPGCRARRQHQGRRLLTQRACPATAVPRSAAQHCDAIRAARQGAGLNH